MPRQVKRIQDPVHGLMEYEGKERAVFEALRSAEVQRLRRISQQGMASLVYPGAEHSRFAHALGTSFLAISYTRRVRRAARGILAEDLIPYEDAATVFALAALCHDLGHGPFSHAWERELEPQFDPRGWAAALGLDADDARIAELKWHELVTQGMLAWQDGSLYRLLEDYEYGLTEKVREFLLGTAYVYYLPRLLNSDIDVDRADYLRRDSLLSGVTYGQFDQRWLLSTLRVGFRDDGEIVVGFDQSKARRCIEQFLIARRAMYDNVYSHPGGRCAEGMAALFLRRLRALALRNDPPTDRIPEHLRPIIKLAAGEIVPLTEFVRVTDTTVWILVDVIAHMSGTTDVTLRDLANRLLSRDLFKAVPVSSEAIVQYWARHQGYDRLYHILRQYVPGDPTYYVMPDEVRFEMFSQDERCFGYFIDQDGHSMPVQQHPDLREIWHEPETSWRLFTVREAVSDIEQELTSGR